MNYQSFWIFCFLLVGCHEIEHPNTRRETFLGRHGKLAIYHADVPFHWERIDTVNDLTDTKIPICSYKIEDAILTLHNFPYTALEMRIPPEAQVKRWQDQIPNGIYDTTPLANSGFGGFRLEAVNEEKGVIAYAMQLTPVIFRALPSNDLDLKADYTIKFTGSPESIEKNRRDVDAFALSFEWISPIEYGKL